MLGDSIEKDLEKGVPLAEAVPLEPSHVTVGRTTLSEAYVPDAKQPHAEQQQPYMQQQQPYVQQQPLYVQQQQQTQPNADQPQPNADQPQPNADQPQPNADQQQPVGTTDTIDKLELSIRHGFIRKVFGLLFVQLLITFGIVLGFSYSDDAAWYVRSNSWVVWVSLTVLIVSLVILFCGNFHRKYPWNYILGLLFTLSMGTLLGYVAAFYSTEVVWIAIGSTMGLCVVLILFACQTKLDFTGWGPYLAGAVWVLLWFGIFASFSRNRTMYLLYAFLGVLLYSVFLVYETQKIVNGKSKERYSVDDYVPATLSLYMDIIVLFMFILALVGARQ